MTAPKRTPVGLRLVAVAAAAMLLLGLVLASSRDRDASPPDQSTSLGAPPDAEASDASDLPATSTQDVAGGISAGSLEPLTSADAAEQAGTAALRAAIAAAAGGAWPELLDAAWQDRASQLAQAGELAAYVGDVTYDGDTGAVRGDLVIVPTVGPRLEQLVLRVLPGAAVLESAGAGLQLAATVGGADVAVRLDPEAATATLDVTEVDLGSHPLRVSFSYVVPALDDIVDDGGPAGFGLLARTGSGAMLGHALPLLTFDDGPMVAFGDVGAFPPAVFSVTVRSDDVVITGGAEGPCEVAASDCVLARGVGLRDLAIATFRGAPQTATATAAVSVTAGAGLPAARVQTVADESLAALEIFAKGLGPLPWPDFEVALLPLRSAAGMEFPGLVVVDPEYLDRLDGGFGTFVVVHEAAHQWFHALVGSSSLADPVVDESIAQYLSHWFYAEAYGDTAAADLFDRYLVRRYRAARNDGLVDIAPASPLAAFGSDKAYGPLVYGRSPLAWTAAEQAVGRDVVRSFLADVVRARGLATVTSSEIVELAAARDPVLGAVLERWWTDATPVDDELD